MARTCAIRPALLIVGLATIGCLFPSASNLEVDPPNVLDSDLNTCECYQENVYPRECPLTTPQLDQLCSDISAYEYNETLTEQFCNASCLDALSACYQQHPGNCSELVLDYYQSSFCTRNVEGKYCLSVGVNALELLPDLVTSCSAADGLCPLPSDPCIFRDLCSNLLEEVVNSFGCCAASLLDHPLSPFANFSIGNTYAYNTCGVPLGEKCPVNVEVGSGTVSTASPPSVLPATSTPSALLATSTPSPSPGNGGANALSFKLITIFLSVVCALCIL